MCDAVCSLSSLRARRVAFLFSSSLSFPCCLGLGLRLLRSVLPRALALASLPFSFSWLGFIAVPHLFCTRSSTFAAKHNHHPHFSKRRLHADSTAHGAAALGRTLIAIDRRATERTFAAAVQAKTWMIIFLIVWVHELYHGSIIRAWTRALAHLLG